MAQSTSKHTAWEMSSISHHISVFVPKQQLHTYSEKWTCMCMPNIFHVYMHLYLVHLTTHVLMANKFKEKKLELMCGQTTNALASVHFPRIEWIHSS